MSASHATSSAVKDFQQAGSMQELYDLLDKHGIENGWNKKVPSLWPFPREPYVPTHWSYRVAKAALDAAGRFVNTELAERRNLILANPIPGNTYPTVRTMIGAYQMVKAGETARSHRHSANALRFVLEAKPGAYTIVDGQKVPMVPGDVLLTPNWSWHAHSNESEADAYWMDFLDVPTVHLLGPMFFEHHPDGIEQSQVVAADSPFRFPWEQTMAKLDAAGEIASGQRMVSLEPFMATIALDVYRVEPGVMMTIEPSTINSVWACMDGEGDASIGGQAYEIGRGDAMAAPSCATQRFVARSRLHLLRVSDRPLLEKLGWLRAAPANPA